MFSLHIDTARTWRGGQNQVLLTVNGLRARGDRVVLVAHPSGELRRRASEGVELVPLVPRSEIDLAAAWRLARVIRALRPNIVHAHDPHGVSMAALARSLARADARFALVAARRVDFPLRGNAFSRWKYRQVDAFIAASDAIRRILLNDGVSPDRLAMVHEGVDVARVAGAPRVDLHSELRLPAGSPIVGNVAALVPHKGQRHLIDAVPMVLRSVPEARFVIAGDGELCGALERQIRDLHVEQQVFLTGFRRDVPGLIKAFDVFVMSSTTEGLGTSLLDAMACGRAIVATRAGGIPEVVADGETGFVVPTHDAGALGTAIVRLLQESALRQQMGEAGRARVHAHFSVERMVEETTQVYSRVSAARRD